MRWKDLKAANQMMMCYLDRILQLCQMTATHSQAHMLPVYITNTFAITILQFNVAVVPKSAIIINIDLIGDIDHENIDSNQIAMYCLLSSYLIRLCL